MELELVNRNREENAYVRRKEKKEDHLFRGD